MEEEKQTYVRKLTGGMRGGVWEREREREAQTDRQQERGRHKIYEPHNKKEGKKKTFVSVTEKCNPRECS